MKTLATIPQSPVALADMSVPQLAEAGKALDRAGDLHEKTAGTCRILHGLVLKEAKRKLDHGKFIPWVKKEFPNSHREANRRMRAADDFIAVLSDKKQVKKLKLDMPVQFDAQRLLLGDLATNLTEISAAQLDMSNPVVKAASAYVGKRSWTQLLLDLGPAPLGGPRVSLDDDGEPKPRIRRTNDEIEMDDFKFAAKTACTGAVKAFAHLFSVQGPHKPKEVIPRAWDTLDDKALRQLKEFAIDLREGILESEKRRAQLRPRK